MLNSNSMEIAMEKFVFSMDTTKWKRESQRKGEYLKPTQFKLGVKTMSLS
jgi:hypothetical protein